MRFPRFATAEVGSKPSKHWPTGMSFAAEHAHAHRVNEDVRSGLKSGVQGTPTFFVDGLRRDGPIDLATLRAALEETTR